MKTIDSIAPSVLLAVVVSAAGLLSGCSPPAQAQGGSQRPAPPTVTVAPVEQRELVEYDEFNGRLDAVETVEVRPRISGHLTEVHIQSGQLVKKGDLLFVIDPRWQKATLTAAEAELARAKSRLANVEREASRAESLLLEKAISSEEAESRRSKLSEARSTFLAAQAARDTAALDLEVTEVRAPIDGRVSRALVTVGNYVTGIPGFTTVLTTIVSADPMYVYADVDEATLLKLDRLKREGKLLTENGRVPIDVGLSDEQGFPTRGYLESFDTRLDPASGSILLRAVVPNTDGRFVPGLFARLRVPGGEVKPLLLISDRAVGTDQSQKFVLTLSSSNTVEYRPITLGPILEGKRVVRDGLRVGEQVVINGLQRVRPGMPVKPEIETAAPTAPKLASK